MARRIIAATDYGFRKVIRVVMDDTRPEWVHPDDAGLAHSPGLARGRANPDGSRGGLDPTLAPGTECHACVFNHDVREITFTGEELDIEDPPRSGTIRPKTDAELVAEVQLRLVDRPQPRLIGELQNMVI